MQQEVLPSHSCWYRCLCSTRRLNVWGVVSLLGSGPSSEACTADALDSFAIAGHTCCKYKVQERFVTIKQKRICFIIQLIVEIAKDIKALAKRK